MQRRMVAREVKHCKNAWFQKKAREVEIAVRKGRGAWKGLRAIQRGRAGLRPVRPNAIKDISMVSCVLVKAAHSNVGINTSIQS